MSNKRFDDEVLSAIIDGEADAATVASVEADPAARDRLERMRQGVLLVAKPVAEATAERRSASIAAALATAYSAPEVTSLTAVRQDRENDKKRTGPKKLWLAGVAAAAAFLIAIPLALSLGGSNTTNTAADTVTDAAEISNDAAVGDALADGDAMDGAEEAMADDDAEAAGEFDRETVEEAMADDAANDPRANRVNTSDLASANTVDQIDELLNIGSLAAKYDAATVVAAGVAEQCARPQEGVSAERPYDLINLNSFGGAERLILVEFADNGMTRVLDAEDCSSLR